ncbi:MAG: VOC family protein, partial [Candidatus Eremiobacteraeota bacterium]|nr:VOC family protein [Candidatus Eremiobacteraeota bacterium]
MSLRTEYPAGVPCWVDTLQPDPHAAMRFYGQLFGWEFAGPGHMPDGGEYYVAQLRGLDVAGIGSMPKASAGPGAFWNTYVAVDDLDRACE